MRNKKMQKTTIYDFLFIENSTFFFTDKYEYKYFVTK